MEKYLIDSLILEVTRACNMNCKHCLRGSVPKEDSLFVPKTTITKLLRHVSEIGTITFSGGEPSLAVPQIKHTLRMLNLYQIPVRSFYIATNGKLVSNEFLNVMDNLFLYCMQCQTGNLLKFSGLERYQHVNWCYDEFYGGVALSIDEYHETIPVENILKLKSRSYFREDKIWDEPSYVIKRGNAVGLNLPKNRIIDRVPSEFVIDENRIETLYMNIHGELMADCDLSYKDQYVLAVASVHNPDCFKTIIQSSVKDETFT